MRIKRMFAFLAAFCLCFYTPAYAREASPSDALRVGAALDADPWYSLDDVLVDDSGIMPLVSNLYGQDWVYLSIWKNKNTDELIYVPVKYVSGRYLWENPDPSLYVPHTGFIVDIYNLPASGTYNLKWDMYSANAYPSIQSLSIQYIIKRHNTENLYERVRGIPFKTHNTYWAGDNNITIPSSTYNISFIFTISQPSNNVNPFDMGAFTYKFYQKQDTSAGDPIAPPSDPPSTPEQDISNGVSNIADVISGAISDGITNISSGMNQLVSLQEQTNDLILQVVQTISNQLEAFWNQLAGEFTNLYNKLTDQHDELINENRDNTEDIMDNADNNTDRLIDNDNNNRDHIENGYDINGWNEQKEKIDGAIAEYESAEDELLGGAKDNLNNFDFDNPFTQFNAVMVDISSILSGIYNTLGSFNIPIGFSLTLTVAMLCIGWYRFKGGL